MPRESLDAVTISDQDTGALPVELADAFGNVIKTTRMTLQASGAQTAGGQSGAVSVTAFKELLLFLEVTAVSGTTPALNVFLDASDDGGVTWFQVAQLGPANIAGVPASPAPNTYLLTLGLGSSSGGFGDTVRVRWTISGTTPSFTFAVKAVGK